jgi:hypothetical protein
MVFCMCPDSPPEKVSAKGGKGVQQNLYLNAKNNPNEFALGLKDAACTEPLCCCAAGLGAPCGFTACWARKSVLEKLEGGMEDYVCFQGYIPACCCINPSSMCKGSAVGLFLEGCLCPVFSLSIARLHMMDRRQLRPDPMDYQIIACSNFLQLASCILDLVAAFVEQARDAALILVRMPAREHTGRPSPRRPSFQLESGELRAKPWQTDSTLACAGPDCRLLHPVRRWVHGRATLSRAQESRLRDLVEPSRHWPAGHLAAHAAAVKMDHWSERAGAAAFGRDVEPGARRRWRPTGRAVPRPQSVVSLLLVCGIHVSAKEPMDTAPLERATRTTSLRDVSGE